MVYATSTTVNGTVAAVNPKGIKLAPQDEWFNVSRYATDVIFPERGESVTLVLDKSGFVRSVQPENGGSAFGTSREAGDGPGAVQDANGSSGGAQGRSGASTAQRDRTITRLACLKAAAEYASSKPESKSTDVLLIAAAWERWINREQETTYDLDAADDDAAF